MLSVKKRHKEVFGKGFGTWGTGTVSHEFEGQRGEAACSEFRECAGYEVVPASTRFLSSKAEFEVPLMHKRLKGEMVAFTKEALLRRHSHLRKEEGVPDGR